MLLPRVYRSRDGKLFAQLANENHLTLISDRTPFAARAAHYIAEINAIHPFREGNGRCQLTLLDVLFVSGFEINEELIEPDRFMSAMIASFHGENGALAEAIPGIMS